MLTETVNLVEQFEGFSDVPYLCPARVWTIGYGTIFYPNGNKVMANDKPCSEAQAHIWLQHDMLSAELSAYRLTKVQLNPYQIGAITSFIYNLGSGAFRASTLRRRINSGDWDDVPYQLSRWIYGGGRRLRGLVIRREAEARLWVKDVNRI